MRVGFTIAAMVMSVVSCGEASTAVSSTPTPAPSAATMEGPVDQQLLEAIKSGDLDAMSAAIEAGADVEMSSGGSELRALHVAAINSNRDGLELLLDAGADVDSTDKRAMTALIHALDAGDVEGARLLIERGADVNHQTEESYGPRPVHVASERGLTEIIELLLELGVDANQLAGDRSNPLHWASLSGHLDSMRVLIDAGTELEQVDDLGFTPLELAPNDDAEALLVEAGATR